MHNKRRKINIAGYIITQAVIFILLILTFSLMWAKENYGSIGMSQIIFTLNMPLKGTSNSFLEGYIQDALIPVLCIFLVELLVTLPRKIKNYIVFNYNTEKKFPKNEMLKVQIYPLRLRWFVVVSISLIWMFALIQSADKAFGLIDFAKSQLASSELIENEYVDPGTAGLTFPEKKRNIITIFIESAESTNQDIGTGGYFDINYIPEMTKIAEQNISFSQSDLIEGAAVAPASGWTMAGLVAETAGLPLKLFKYDDKNGGDNYMELCETFLPGATTFGDILKEAGYENYFMAGSKFEFGGRKTYFTQHGDYEIWDYNTAIDEGKIDENYFVWWGFEDKKLYTYAKEELLKIAENDEPFNFSILTSDTHHVGGYRCDLCPDTYETQYANVWACASRQLNDFVEWIKQQAFYENTTIVIVGDHASMDPEFYGDFSYEKHHGDVERKVYNAVINSAVEPINEKNRKFTTMDMFPTILAAMGVEIDGNRLGLGTNLFSQEETLSEKYGYEVLFNELDRKSLFYDRELLYSK